MPSKSASQHRLMAASCKGDSGAVPKDVACEFMEADRGKVKRMPERLGILRRGKKKGGGRWSKWRPK